MGVFEGKLSVIRMLVQIFSVLVGVYRHIWIRIMYFQQKSFLERAIQGRDIFVSKYRVRTAVYVIKGTMKCLYEM